MKIAFDTKEIMRAAWTEFRQRRALGAVPELPFSYFLRRAWQGAQQHRAFWRSGATAIGSRYEFCFFVEN